MNKYWTKYRDFNQNTCWAYPYAGEYIRVIPFLFGDERRYSLGYSDDDTIEDLDKRKIFKTAVEAFEYVEAYY